MAESGSSRAVDRDDRRKHLDFIQAVVTRMSAASSTTKSWLLPVVTATYGYALTKNATKVALLGIAAVTLFAILDANYLRQEKAYRRLYDAVARNTRDVPLFSLDPSDAIDPVIPGTLWWKKVLQCLGQWIPDRTVWLSWSITPFYSGLVLMGAAISLVVR